MTVVKNKVYECDICGELFTDRTELRDWLNDYSPSMFLGHVCTRCSIYLVAVAERIGGFVEQTTDTVHTSLKPIPGHETYRAEDLE